MSSNIQLTPNKAGDRLLVISPYHPYFPAPAKEIGGKFITIDTTDGAHKGWSFDARDEQRVRELLISVYGTDGTPTACVTARVDLDKIGGRQIVVALGRVLAERRGRDYGVKLGDGVIIAAGGFPGTGGSVKNPRLDQQDGTVLLVRDVPVGHTDLARPGITIEITEEPDRPALQAERARLLARVAQIDDLLAGDTP